MQRNFTEASFNAALARARAREAAEIQAVKDGKESKSVDIYKMLDDQLRNNTVRAFNAIN